MSEEKEEESQAETTVLPFKTLTPIRPKLDQADLQPNVNQSKIADFGDKSSNTTTLPPTDQPRMAASTIYLPTVFPAARGGALNGTAATIAPIHIGELNTTKKPTTREKGTPLKDYPTVFPGLAYPSNRPSKQRHNDSIIATTPSGVQNENAVTAKLPEKVENPSNESAKYFQQTTPRPVYQTTNAGVNMFTTRKPSAKYGTPNEETANAKQKDEFAYQNTQNNAETSVVVPHQVFNPEQEAQDDQAAEEERQRLLAMTTKAPVTFMRDSDEDVTSPDNQNKDNDWHGLQYGPLALPPAFKGQPSIKG